MVSQPYIISRGKKGKMEIFKILDELEEMVRFSKKVPLSGGKIMIEKAELMELLDRLRAALPEELDSVRLILSEKDRIIKEACAEADQYIEQSREKALRLIDNSEITQRALQKSDEIIAIANQKSKEIYQDANEYADGVLTHIEMVLKRGLEAISMGKEEVKATLTNREED